MKIDPQVLLDRLFHASPLRSMEVWLIIMVPVCGFTMAPTAVTYTWGVGSSGGGW